MRKARKCHRLARWAALTALTLPLLSTGTCLQIGEQSVIQGFFNVVTPLVVDGAQKCLGLSKSATGAQRTPTAVSNAPLPA